ncbi:MAG: DUF6002 family protein [Actinocatenispora sp.]
MSNPPSRNLILDYYDRLPDVIAECVPDTAPVKETTAFSPGFALPTLDDDVREFFSVADARWWHLADHDSGRVMLLDLTRNPGTRTTKTLASLLIVARAVEYIRRTGEPVLIFSPTSANKGTALRDAVRRAIACGLATPDQLRIAILAPANCREKLRGGGPDPDLNPVFLYGGERAEDVKAIGREFVNTYAGKLRANVWFSLELNNYLIGDAARAFFEHDVDPTPAASPRLHAHAVSSAFGLLGYNVGRRMLERSGAANATDRPAFLLVQHLGAPDMVINLRHGDFDRGHLPDYAIDPATGLYAQSTDPRFPAVTYDPAEVLDPTFYTHEPATSPAMNELIGQHGGDGIVVSLHECIQRYPTVRRWLSGTDRQLPADLRVLREWSLVMAMTGVLNALDRDLIGAGRDIVVHGSGTYGATDYPPLDASAAVPVRDAEDVARALLAAE